MNVLPPTCKRRDGLGPTPFSDWLRGEMHDPKLYQQNNIYPIIQITDVSEISSSLGYRATNVDYIWRIDQKFMLIEEKRHLGYLSFSQRESFSLTDRAAENYPTYYGFWIIRFEHTNPEDGKTWISRFDKKMFSKDYNPMETQYDIPRLLKFLKMEWAIQPVKEEPQNAN